MACSFPLHLWGTDLGGYSTPIGYQSAVHREMIVVDRNFDIKRSRSTGIHRRCLMSLQTSDTRDEKGRMVQPLGEMVVQDTNLVGRLEHHQASSKDTTYKLVQ